MDSSADEFLVIFLQEEPIFAQVIGGMYDLAHVLALVPIDVV
jgi:hypothetical protein